jgi:hypothetical protein
MKNKIIIFIFGLSLFLISNSCQDEFLVEKPTTFLSSANLFDKADDARLALTGVYSSLHGYRFFNQEGIIYFWGDMGVDIEVVPSWGYIATGMYKHTPSYSYVGQIWQSIYRTAYRANTVLNRVEQMDDGLFEEIQYGSETMNEKDVILGEAYFLRALVYHYGVMIYGNMPLITDETTDLNVFPSQVTPKELYDQVVADLQMAESLLPWERRNGEEGHATQGAAKSLLGKVYLQMTGFPLYQEDKFSMAATKLKEVIDSGTYGLLDRYGDIFDPGNEDNKEWIFTVKYDPDLGQSTNTGSFQGITGDVTQGGGYNNLEVNEDFVAKFDSSDIRFWWNISKRDVKGYLISTYTWKPWKYHTPPGKWPSSAKGFDYPVLRYSEVLLMYAEALNGANPSPPAEAYEAINRVRRRARLDEDDASYTNNPAWLNDLIAQRIADHPTDENVLPDIGGLTKEEFLTALLEEQAKELCWEGKRKSILIRTGKLKEYITAPQYNMQNFSYYPGQDFNEDRDLWWPIPQRELDINPNLVQNPGGW